MQKLWLIEWRGWVDMEVRSSDFFLKHYIKAVQWQIPRDENFFYQNDAYPFIILWTTFLHRTLEFINKEILKIKANRHDKLRYDESGCLHRRYSANINGIIYRKRVYTYIQNRVVTGWSYQVIDESAVQRTCTKSCARRH